jgi:NAD(P)-dependent dehydrogenase (short-subunit alcohol dehydrogenase family)
MTPLKIEGRAAVITGAASGIGRALAMEAGARGMQVAIADVNADGLAETERALSERQVRVLARALDVRDAEAVEAFGADCFERFESIALVWANAGINCYNSAIRPNLAAWNDTIDINLRGPIHCMAAFVGRLVDRAEPARFVITGSQASFVAAPELGAYVATKHALWGIAETLRIELAQAQSPVGASLLAPPRVATGIIAVSTERVRAKGGDEAVAQFLAGMSQPDSIARIATDAAVAGDFLIVPDNEIRDVLRDRVAPLM